MSPIIRAITRADYTPWQSIFQAYVTFYKSFLPDTQYQTTFGRLINSETTELHGLVMVHPEDPDKLIGFAHFFPHQTPWSEKKIMHLNDLFVDPEVRSKGYGRQLIQAVVDIAKEKDRLRVQWATQHGNPARKLYDQMATCDSVEYRVKF